MKKREISATIIADSISPDSKRLTSYVLVFPRIILAEFNTHRVFTRNSSSSRAIPFKKMLKIVWNDPFIPIAWMQDHTGMQGNRYFTGARANFLKFLWLSARNFAVIFAWFLSKAGLTKQIVNRLLEPFMWHTVIATATDFENFFKLRADPAAEIHIQELAYLMLEAYNESIPKKLTQGQWHIPFGDNIDASRLTMEELGSNYDVDHGENITRMKIKIATARCARVSYLNFEGKDDYSSDIALYDRLAGPGHYSPFEHCAKVPEFGDSTKYSPSNFDGWVQLRKTMHNENQSDSRVDQKTY